MSIQKTTIILMSVIVAGCTSMLTHQRFEDQAVILQAQQMAALTTCVDKGVISGGDVYAYGYAMSQLYSVSVYNEKLYESTYQSTKQQVNTEIVQKEELEKACNLVTQKLPPITQSITQQYISIMQDRQAELSGMSQSASSLGSNMPAYTQTSISMPANQVGFGSDNNKTKHYLVNFGSGQRLCSATASGYVRCN